MILLAALAPLIKLAASQRVGEIIRRVLFFLVSKKFNLLSERERVCARARAHTHFSYFYSARFVPRVNFLKETVAPSDKRIEFPVLFRLPFQSNFTSFAYIFIFRVVRALSYRLTFAPRFRAQLCQTIRCWGFPFMYYSRYGTRTRLPRFEKW